MQTINRHTRLYTSARGNRVEFSLHWSATSARPNRNLKVLEKGSKVFGALFKVGPEQLRTLVWPLAIIKGNLQGRTEGVCSAYHLEARLAAELIPCCPLHVTRFAKDPHLRIRATRCIHTHTHTSIEGNVFT